MSGMTAPSEASAVNATLTGTCSNYDGGSIVLGIGLCVVASVSLVGNLLTIAAFVTNHSLRQKPSNFLLLSLSCGDLLVGISLLVRISESICRTWLLGEGVCQFQTFYIDIGVVVGFLSMSSIALDRYLLISREYPKYIALQTRRNVLRTIAVVWAISIAIAFLEIIIWNTMDWESVNGQIYEFHHECLSPPRNNPIFALTVFFVTFLTPIICIVGMSLRFLVLLRRRLQKYGPSESGAAGATRPSEPAHSASSTSQQNTRLKTAITENTNVSSSSFCAKTCRGKTSDGSVDDSSTNADQPENQTAENVATYSRRGSSQEAEVQLSAKDKAAERSEADKSTSSKTPRSAKEQLRRRYIRPAVIMITLVVCFLVCTLPYMVYISVVIRLCPACDDEQVRYHLLNVLFLNSAINPFVYAATHPKIRDFHRRVFGSLVKRLRCSRAEYNVDK